MFSEEEERNLNLARRYVEMVNNPATTVEDLKACFDESVIWQEMPNRFAPAGRKSDYKIILASWNKGREYLPQQTYNLRRAIASGDTVVLEIDWTGIVERALPPFAAGTRLSAQIAVFLRFRDGKIVGQTDYPCYDPIAESGSEAAGA